MLESQINAKKWQVTLNKLDKHFEVEIVFFYQTY